jgi:hypothetical protein
VCVCVCEKEIERYPELLLLYKLLRILPEGSRIIP